MKQKNIKIFRITMWCIVAIILLIATIYLFPVIKKISTIEGQIQFKQKIAESGFYGILILFLLQFAQIFLFIVPGEPIEILAGMCYGSVWGTIFIMLSSACVTTVIFAMVRKFGKDFIYSFCSEEKVKKFESNSLFNNPKKIEWIVFLLFIIPGTPKDLLTYICGLFPIKLSRFVLITTIARIPSIITSTLIGANIAIGNWKQGILLYGGIFLIVAILIFIYNKFDKDKTTEHIIKSLNS